MRTIKTLLKTVQTANNPDISEYRILVVAGWFTVGICILLGFSDFIHFTYQPTNSGVFGYVKANHYPKQQEFFWFFCLFFGVPAVMLIGWCLWIAGSTVAARLSKEDSKPLLKLYALCHLPFLIVWPSIIRLETGAWRQLFTSSGIALLVGLAGSLIKWIARLNWGQHQ